MGVSSEHPKSNPTISGNRAVGSGGAAHSTTDRRREGVSGYAVVGAAAFNHRPPTGWDFTRKAGEGRGRAIPAQADLQIRTAASDRAVRAPRPVVSVDPAPSVGVLLCLALPIFRLRPCPEEEMLRPKGQTPIRAEEFSRPSPSLSWQVPSPSLRPSPKGSGGGPETRRSSGTCAAYSKAGRVTETNGRVSASAVVFRLNRVRPSLRREPRRPLHFG